MTAAAPTWPAEFAEGYRAAGWWRRETFGGMLRERAGAHPDRIAIVDPTGGPDGGRRTWTYGELDLRADRMGPG
ncbi:hypothetical protein [Streptomyces sp. H27-H5]|uniref:hypothetical protein n=1 Tax=Streptomyces sp. H27-H5 TaxID=2996460 RepID=UPI003B63A14D